jgi:hypothetical protein
MGNGQLDFSAIIQLYNKRKITIEKRFKQRLKILINTTKNKKQHQETIEERD